MTELRLEPSLIFAPVRVDDRNAVLKLLAGRMKELGYVKDTYLQAVLDRERAFPTGIAVNGGGVALPHCDPEHVIQPTMALAILEKPVTFGAMTGQGEVLVDIVFMLAMKEPSKQIYLLQQVAFMLQNPELLSALKRARSPKDVTDVLSCMTSWKVDG